MEYLYANLLLEESGTAVGESSLTHVLEAAGVSPERRQVQAFLAALEEMKQPPAAEEADDVPEADVSDDVDEDRVASEAKEEQ